ncbi:phosphoribosylanthranilate isomerase [Georgenia sp. Z1344]|uniref:phosphoribosylanthranilate isomerase n=1 Tax=Georgenia sp. Z1344 TaxID=3416706 RepID=UPI003CEE114B
MFVKICGMRTVEDVREARGAGADAVGIVVSSTSVRAVPPEDIPGLVRAAGGTTTVLVVHDLPVDDAVALARDVGVDVLQLHGYGEADNLRGAATFPRVWRATSGADGPTEVRAHDEEVLLLDSATPGSGDTWDVEELTSPHGRWMLAGGLTPDNVAEMISRVHPWGVDVSSGVEVTRGVKDPALIHRFVAAARSVHDR